MYAVVAQLVERHLAKVEVASPSLVYRSNHSFVSDEGVFSFSNLSQRGLAITKISIRTAISR